MKEHASRAQIFQSFDSLKGFRRQLKLQEKIVVERPLLSEEDLKQLDQRIHPLKTRYARPSHLPRTKRMHPNTGDPVQDQHGHKISANRKNKDPLSFDLIHSGRRARRRPLLYPMKKELHQDFPV